MGFEEFLGVNPWTAVFTLANTVALFLVLKHYLFDKLMPVVHERQPEIDDMYTQADLARQQAQALEADYTKKLSAARETSEAMVKEAVARGQSREEEIIRQANVQASALMDKAAADIAREKKKAVNEAKDQISGLAMDIAQKVVGRSLDTGDQTRLIDQFIEELGDGV